MLFNSYEFLFFYLPVTIAGFFALARHGYVRFAIGWLGLCSLFFYGWWNPVYVPLILASILFNFVVGGRIASRLPHARHIAKRWLVFGIVANLTLLIYYKYANFLVDNVNVASGIHFDLAPIVLPLGISFYSFTQIAFLVDAYEGKAKEYRFLDYLLFVTYFPHLIAGPVLHHKEMMPQFGLPLTFRPGSENFAVGITIFAIGLFKKAVVADGLSPHANRVFALAESGEPIGLALAWGGALAYTFQLYFDFSGYSDMAIGASRLIGIKLPLNFNSPYKATDIADFWRRWHMTLSRFLRDYLYVPLGGNRKGSARRYLNLMITMVLGGIWHGAGWTFLAWGLLHGAYLCIQHGWHAARRRFLPARMQGSSVATRTLARAITFLAVVAGWVFFRAHSFQGASAMLQGMIGLEGLGLPQIILAQLDVSVPGVAILAGSVDPGGGSQFVQAWLWILGASALAFLAPNSQEIMRRFEPALDIARDHAARPAGFLLPAWTPTPVWAGFIACVAVAGLLSLPGVTEFLYFQF